MPPRKALGEHTAWRPRQSCQTCPRSRAFGLSHPGRNRHTPKRLDTLSAVVSSAFGGNYLFFDHRLFAAPAAISRRRSADSEAARALPPFSPPCRPSATAKGFFPSAVFNDVPFVATSTMTEANRLTSLGILDRFCITYYMLSR